MNGQQRPAAAGHTTVREVEIKLAVHGLYRLPDLVSQDIGIARAKRQVTRNLVAVYYDTEDLRLFRWGATLRRREGGADAGWHLKLPVAGATKHVRDELQLPLSAGEPGEIPQELTDIVIPFSRGARLRQVAELHTERTPYLLYDSEGQALAELVDDSVSILNEGAVVERFRELEVEALIPDAPLEQIVEPLRAAGATAAKGNKVSHALGLATAAPPDVLEPAGVSASDPASEAITSFLRKHVLAFIRQDVRVRRDLPDAVHQMRVAARRLRSGLKAFGPLVDSDWSGHLRDELAWAAGELGAARDTEVLLERLDRHAQDLGSKDAKLIRKLIDPQLRDRLDDARDRALTSLQSPRHIALLDALVGAASAPMLTELASEPSASVLPELVDRTYRKLARQVKELQLEGDAEIWHDARKSAKRVRYSFEAVTVVFGTPAKLLADAFSEVTEVLGEHQDACIAQDVLREMAQTEHIDGRTGFALGLLHEHEFELELHARLEFQRIWPTVFRAQRLTKLT